MLLELDNHGQRSKNLCNKVKRIQRRYHYTFKCNEKYCDAFVTLQHKYVDGCLGNDFNDVTVDSEISCYRMQIESVDSTWSAQNFFWSHKKVNSLQEDSRYPSLFTAERIRLLNSRQLHGKTRKLNQDLEKGWFLVDCKLCEHGKFLLRTASSNNKQIIYLLITYLGRSNISERQLLTVDNSLDVKVS